MAQKGRGCPRTRFQRLCPDFTVPQWSPMQMRLGGWLCFDGEGICPELGESTWGAITESPATGTLAWSGEVISHGVVLTWAITQYVSITRPGVDFEVFLSDGGDGFNYSLYHYDAYGFDDDAQSFLVSPELEFWNAPLGPTATLWMKPRRWSEM